MASTTASIEIPAAPEDVWALVTDLSRMGDWVTIHGGFPEPPPASVSEGTTFRQTMKVAGQEVDVEWTAEKVDEPRELRWAADAPMGAKASTAYRLSPAGDGGTRFDYESEYELPGGALGKLAGKAVEGRSGDEAQASLERLRELF